MPAPGGGLFARIEERLPASERASFEEWLGRYLDFGGIYWATTFWTLFFLGGLGSDYYQRWPWYWSLIIVALAPTVLPALAALQAVRHHRRDSRRL